MQVIWQLKSTQNCTVDWGEGSGPSKEKNRQHIHVYTIQGLVPGTHYDYSVSCDNGKVGDGSFTAAPPDNATNVKLFAYGDTRSQPAVHDKLAAEMIRAYSNDPSMQTIVLHSGDWVSSGGKESRWTSQYFNRRFKNLLELQANMPIVGTPGNHLGYGGNSGATNFKKYFPATYPDGSDGEYRSFDYGPAHIVLIDQYSKGGYRKGSKEYQWLEKDLKDSNKKWKFLVFHEPGWTVTGHHGNNRDAQKYIQPLAKKYGVSLILNGHNHFYARAMVDGIAHITTGGGGAPLYTVSRNARDRRNIVAAAKEYNYCTIDVAGGTLTFKAYDIDGREIDSLTMTK